MLTGVIIGAYLIGSVPFALILARQWGATDLRRIGSGNLGAANVLADSGAVNLAGGNLRTSLSDVLGQLSVTAAGSKIILGSSAHSLTFASLDSTGFAGLTIDGWSGVAGSPGTGGRPSS